VDALVAVAPGNLPRAQEVAVDGRVLGFALTVSSLTGLLFALAPAWYSLPGHPGRALHGVFRTVSQSGAGRPLAQLLVVGQVALAVVLLTGGGLFVNSFWRLSQPDPGFASNNVLTFSIEWPYPEYPRPDLAFRLLRTRLLAIPGVEAASTGLQLPDRGLPMIDDVSPFVARERQPPPRGARRRTSVLFTQPGYFRAMGIPVAHGRDFSEEDLSGTVPVAIINASLARTHFPDGDAIGQRVVLESWRLFGESMLEVVGIAGDVQHRGLSRDAQPFVYLPRSAGSGGASFAESYMVVRTHRDPLTFAGAVRDAVASIDPDRPVYDLQTLEQRIGESLDRDRFSAFLLSGFSVFGVLLAGIGLYGGVSQITSQRTREIGIRIALGATTWAVWRLVLGQGMTLAGVGVLLGLGGASVLTRFVESLLFGVSPTDPLTLGAVVALLASVAAVACWIPARYATNVSPTVALRHE
jgi:putative ABC transport system permease protein